MMIHVTQNETNQHAFLATVAESIELKLGLPKGRGLVGVIGDGHERSNRQALVSWIARNCDATRTRNAREVTDRLADDLVMILEDLHQ